MADFRGWLSALAVPPPAPHAEPPVVELAEIVAQFTALRHDVNLQTKATRAATEQAAAVVAKLPAPAAEKLPDVKPLLKAVLDIADSLWTARKQVAKAMDAVEPLANELDTPPVAPVRPGFFARLFGAKPVVSAAPPTAAATKLAPLLAGLADGYAISLRRVEAILSQYGLTAIECEGQPFNPEVMEAIEQVASAGHASRVVVEEIRRGYYINGALHRFAQVKVAR